jgi:hypothetical protein
VGAARKVIRKTAASVAIRAFIRPQYIVFQTDLLIHLAHNKRANGFGIILTGHRRQRRHAVFSEYAVNAPAVRFAAGYCHEPNGYLHPPADGVYTDNGSFNLSS